MYLAVAALVLAAATWGATFPLVKDALRDIAVLEFLAVRFSIAAVVLSALAPRAAWKAVTGGWRAGLIAGGLLALGHVLQTAGIELTRSTNAGFITGLYVVFTPLIAAVVLRRRPTRLVMTGVGLVTVGLALLSLQIVDGRPSFNTGDLLVLGCAVAYAGQIVALGRYAPGSDPLALTIQQFVVTAVVCGVLMPAQPVTAPATGRVWLALLATALGSSVFGISVQTWAQRHVSPTRAAVIFSSEAPFAALFAWLLADERLPSRAWAGAALIMAGMLAAEIRPAEAADEA